jgi:2-dehydro-3-deoxyphosphooctonate aldolase (KDO 8-P synthase)
MPQFSWVNEIAGNQAPLFFILGPCVMEDRDSTLVLAELAKQLSEKLKIKVIFKGSFDKANRTALQNFRGVSVDDGLAVLSEIRTQFELPVMTDVHETAHVAAVGQVVDVLQIPAFLCRQTDLLCAAGKTGKPVNVKKGQFEAPESMQHAIKKVESVGNQNAWLCERGYSFGYHNVVVDYRNFSIMKAFNRPVVFDVTHSVQRPGGLGGASGGDRAMIADLAAAAISQRIAGLYMMIHNEPEKAQCCGPVSVRTSQVESLLSYLIDLDTWVKSHPMPEVW